MTKASFEKIESTEKQLYGPRRLLLCGFSAAAQSKFKTLLNMLQISDLPLIWITSAQLESSIEALLDLPDGGGEGKPTKLPRAIIVSGITEKELHRLMSGCRQAGMQSSLWAVVTPTSIQWTVQKLLAELSAEQKAMRRG